jgi:hypothetical protein
MSNFVLESSERTKSDLVEGLIADSRELLDKLQDYQVEHGRGNDRLNTAMSKLIGARASLEFIRTTVKEL